MDWAVILLIVFGAIALVIGLLLSSSGSTSGLSAMAGQDLELFKKTKDRGFIKVMQMIMFIIFFIIMVALIIYLILKHTS
ncbi:preprotein translocase subunit SecG [Candidatus Malacoplasma girerdii]|uniref:Preprotein translocase subunit SecG n=1 Tax=Candidatus Malacoplasma girerdii TaxID=1318617 RepID=A0A097SS54_9BACT|nr:preprotein translocase subunit SecG [Candidatus Malacoplasma girerdii]ASJ88950.1 MAG: preprotein translocase subunit SecG [Candidatus Malacoplasma girerdii]